MSDKRQKIQMYLAFDNRGRSEAPKPNGEGTEPLTAERRNESPANSIEQMAKELSGYLRGWKSYFGFCQTPSVLEALDQWIRRRLRSVIWKYGKQGKHRFRLLNQRGVSCGLGKL